jgi:hypothetical protein
MVIPAIGIIPGNEDGRVFPLGTLLQLVDGLDEEGLFEQRARRGRMTGLVCRGLQETYRRQVVGRKRVPEIGQRILMVGLVCVSNGTDRRRRQVMRIRRGGVVLKRGVVRVVLGDALGLAAAGACRCPVSVEPAPCNALGIEQVADIPDRKSASRPVLQMLGGGRGIAGCAKVSPSTLLSATPVSLSVFLPFSSVHRAEFAHDTD